MSVLVEGGGELLGSFFDAGLIDAVAAFVAPCLVGGKAAKSPLAGRGVATLADATKLRYARTRKFGADILIEGCITDVNIYFRGVAAATKRLKKERR